jgi:hypothetical protein
MYWLFILFAFPLLGSIVYFFAIYLPHSRIERGAIKAVSAAIKAMDPNREVREAQAAFENTPTAQNQMRLAAALLEVGQAAEAAAHYEHCLQGPFAADPEIRFGAARAWVECQRYPQALRYLESLHREQAEFRSEAVLLLLARSYAGLSKTTEARTLFEEAVTRFGSWESKAEYAIWAYSIKDLATASRLQNELDRISARWSAITRDLNEVVYHRLRAAQQLASKPDLQ